MLGVAWRGRHWTVFTVGLSLALVTAGRTIAELLFAPAVLRVLEQGMALGRLLAVIGGFSVLLVALTFLQSYLSERNLFGKMTSGSISWTSRPASGPAPPTRTCWTSASWI